MKTIEIKYIVDNKDWTDGQFEDEPERTFHITSEMLTDLIFSNNRLNKGEFISEIEDIKIIR